MKKKTKTKKPQKKTYVCADCGSSDVTIDALASWNVKEQKWEVSSELDNSDCNDCCSEVELREKKIK